MKKIVFVGLLSIISISGFSQTIDTLGLDEFRNGITTLYTSPNGGFVFGNNGYDDLVKAQSFDKGSAVTLQKVLLEFGDVVFSSGDANSAINVNVYNNYGAGIVVGSGVLQDSIAPDSIIAQMSIPVSQLFDDGSFTIADFSSENVILTDDFSVGIDLSLLSTGDTVGLNSTTDGDANGSNDGWELTSDSVWFQVAESAFSWGLDVQMAIFPVVELDATASINEQSISVSISPNPTSNFLNINFAKSGKYEIQLIDVAGRKVLSATSKNNLSSIDVSHLNSGLYILSVSDGLSKSAYHIIKE
jgi:hypothetical protein